MHSQRAAPVLLGALLLALALVSSDAGAFCGFFVGSGSTTLVNRATEVVLMRGGTRTVLTMRNDYEGPPEDFALVVPVPVVLEKANVRTVPRDALTRIDVLGAPRLVEYFEQDPCPDEGDMSEGGTGTRAKGEEGSMGNPNSRGGARPPVTIEAQFDVDEYEILILSATDSGALESWLLDRKYKIPPGAAEALRPYVVGGSKFFVAKVDPAKVRFEGDHAVLSPLRFHYDSDVFTLPIRLGLLNAGPAQDLVVNILANSRYEAANYDNVFVPTNLDVADEARARFDEVYAALFDRTVASRPHAVVTEYAWGASSCDPCPGPTLSNEDAETLGAGVLPAGTGGAWVLTRLHTRYSKETLGDDLVFRPAPPVEGGREDTGLAVQPIDAHPSGANSFQARYVIRHKWKGPVTCSDPRFGVWGGPPANLRRTGLGSVQDPASAPRGKVDLAAMLRVDVPSLGIHVAAPLSLRRLSPFELGVVLGAALGVLVALADRLSRAASHAPASGKRRRA
jgi:hypothetical protein